MPDDREVLHGRLHFFSETGTEGGHWAFQDARFIELNTTRLACTKCYRYWNKKQYPDGPPDPDDVNEQLHVTRFVPVDAVPDDEDLPPFCDPNDHDFEPVSVENWSREGLHILADGDYLTVYSRIDPTVSLWAGTIRLTRYPPFTQHVGGWWIHADQEGVPRDVWAQWFFERCPATLVPADNDDS